MSLATLHKSETAAKDKTIEVIVYSYDRGQTPVGNITEVDIRKADRIGARQFKDAEHLHQSLTMVQDMADDKIYLYEFIGQDMRGVNFEHR